MNIFILGHSMEEIAQAHVDKHIVKMPLEAAQMLSTAVRLTGIDAGYKITHQNHPCSIWVRESLSNWLWLRELAHYLNNEWKWRYYHDHDCKAFEMIKTLPFPPIKDIGLTPFALCMDDKYKVGSDAVLSYRNYYNNAKKHIFSWQGRQAPKWIGFQ